jgi:hypothetical protein
MNGFHPSLNLIDLESPMPAMELVNHASWLGASGLILDPTRDYATANERPCTPPDLAHLVVVGLLAYREPVQAHVP